LGGVLVIGLLGGSVSEVGTEDMGGLEVSRRTLKNSLYGGLEAGLFVFLFVLFSFLAISFVVGLVGGFVCVLVGCFVCVFVSGLVGGLVGGLVFGLVELKRIKAIAYIHTPYQRILGGFSFKLLLVTALFIIFGLFNFSAYYFWYDLFGQFFLVLLIIFMFMI